MKELKVTLAGSLALIATTGLLWSQTSGGTTVPGSTSGATGVGGLGGTTVPQESIQTRIPGSLDQGLPAGPVHRGLPASPAHPGLPASPGAANPPIYGSTDNRLFDQRITRPEDFPRGLAQLQIQIQQLLPVLDAYNRGTWETYWDERRDDLEEVPSGVPAQGRDLSQDLSRNLSRDTSQNLSVPADAAATTSAGNIATSRDQGLALPATPAPPILSGTTLIPSPVGRDQSRVYSDSETAAPPSLPLSSRDLLILQHDLERLLPRLEALSRTGFNQSR